MEEITIQELAQQKPDTYMVIDMRDSAAFALGHIDGAVLIPQEELETNHETLPKDKLLVIYCRSGILSDDVAAKLREELDFLVTVRRAEMEQKLKKAQFGFDDYLESMAQVKNMGGISSILSMMPGIGNKAADIEAAVDESKMARIEAIILSMTPKERSNPDLLNPSRKKRIAKGAGVDISEVNKLVKQFEQTRKMMKQFPGMMGGKGAKRGRFKLPF